jgi:hypothetical protein
MFINDDFKATSKLTLNFGLRWEQAQPLTETQDRWANFTGDVMNTDKNLPGALEFASADRRSFEGPRDWKGFSPRLGVAYRATDRLVLRGGYGIFMIPLGIQSWSALPYAGSSTVPHYFGSNNNNRQGQLPLFNWDEGYPDNFVGAPAEFRPNYLSWAAFAIDPETLKLGYTHQYNASVQWQFNTDTTIEFTFMGNRGRRIHSGAVRKNQTGTVAEYEAMDNPGAWVWDQGSAEAAGVEYFPGFSGYASWGLSEFPHVLNTWGPVYWISSPRGSYSKAKGNVSTAFDEPWDVNGGIQDGFNLDEAADTVLGYDQAHIFKGYASYELPCGRGRTWLADSPGWVDAILGGWMITGIFRYNSGTAMGAGPNVWRPGWTMTSAVYADADPNVQVDKLWGGNSGFDPANPTASGNLFFEGDQYFSNPEGWKLGTGKGRYDGHRGFGWSNEDIGLMKFWRFGEAASLQLRAEFLNIFNRHHMSNPNTSIASSQFGYVTSTTGRPRNVQVGLRLAW